MISVCFLWGNVLPGGELQIDAKNSNFKIFESAVYGGGTLNFFSGRGVRPGFPKCGACELTFASEKGGL